jgi:hypothetical protein
MKVEEKKKDKDFVNLHQIDRKRKFRDLQNSSDTSAKNAEIPKQNSFTENIDITKNEKNFFTGAPERKILSIKSNKNNSNILKNSYLTDVELEKLINEVSVLSSRDDIKNYLRSKISNMLNQGKKYF